MRLKFACGEIVLCWQGPHVYEAKCISGVITRSNNTLYLVHYSGCNKKWDEWVQENKLLKYNSKNLELREKLEREHSLKLAKIRKKNAEMREARRKERTSSRSKKRSSDDKRSVAESNYTKMKRGRIRISNKLEERYKCKLKINIPQELKDWLLNYNEIFAKNKRLHRVPARPNLTDIIDMYFLHKTTSEVHTKETEYVLKCVTDRVEEYFNKTMDCQFLCSFERPQFVHVLRLERNKHTPASYLFGAIHLLRLFAKMRPWLMSTERDLKFLEDVSLQIQDLLKFLLQNYSVTFTLQQLES